MLHLPTKNSLNRVCKHSGWSETQLACSRPTDRKVTTHCQAVRDLYNFGLRNCEFLAVRP